MNGYIRRKKATMRKKAEMDREQFVAGPLTKCLRETRAGIDHLYFYETDTDEFAIIVYNNGYEREVCITADSNAAIIYDVIDEVLRH